MLTKKIFNSTPIILSAVVMGVLLSMMSPLTTKAQTLPQAGNAGLDRGVESSQNTTMLAQIELLRELILKLQSLVEQKRAMGAATAAEAQNRAPVLPINIEEAQGMADQYRPVGDVRGAHTSREEAAQKISELRSKVEELQSQMRALATATGTAQTGTGRGSASSLENVLPTLPEQASDRAKQVRQCLQLNRSLGLGSRGADVQQIQEFLKEKGFFSSETATGYFGPVTRDAIKAFQASKGIVSNGAPETTGFGRVGPRTQAALAQASCLNEGRTTEENEVEEDDETEEDEEVEDETEAVS